MPDRRKSCFSFAAALRYLAGAILHPRGPHSPATRALYAEILLQLNRNQSLDELLRLPALLCETLQLDAFQFFLLDGSSYRPPEPDSALTAFPASCSTVSRMKRDRRPAVFALPGSQEAKPDGWQMLATNEELALLTRLGTQLLLPLEGRTRLAGFVSLSRPGRRSFALYEFRFLRDLGPQLGRALETALFVETLSRQAVERERVQRELALAREVQERLLPQTLPQVRGLELAAACRSAEQVGGDYYDAFLTPGGQLCVVVGDVSGKGVSAALVMASLRAILHALLLEPGVDPANLLTRCNTLLYQASSASRYATLFLSLYDPVSHIMTYVNAGHNPPLLRRVDGSIERLATGGSVLGLLPEVPFRAGSVRFNPGDTLLAYTDGVSEAMNARLEEWQESGILAAWQDHPGESADALITHLLARLARFVSGAPQHDDLTLLVLRRTSIGAA